jgi:hypothetical protein
MVMMHIKLILSRFFSPAPKPSSAYRPLDERLTLSAAAESCSRNAQLEKGWI